MWSPTSSTLQSSELYLESDFAEGQSARNEDARRRGQPNHIGEKRSNEQEFDKLAILIGMMKLESPIVAAVLPDGSRELPHAAKLDLEGGALHWCSQARMQRCCIGGVINDLPGHQHETLGRRYCRSCLRVN